MTTRLGSAVVTLPSDTEILITRSFEAPRWLVWEAMTQPRHLLRWWGPTWCPMVTCEVDLRPGGAWRYVSRMADGTELGWHGTYRRIEPTELIESTEVFEGFPDAESVNTVTLAEADGVTTVQTLVRHSSKEHRDGHVDSGMEGGMQETFDRLDAILAASDSPAERFRRVAGRFGDRVAQVPADAWERPAPPEGWTARDVVRHLVEWVPAVIGRSGIALPADPPETPSVDHDPLGAWTALAEALQAALDDPVVAATTYDVGPPGEMTVEASIGMIVTGDVVVHTWDLARATGLDEEIDPIIAGEMLVGMQPLDAVLRESGHYGPKVELPEGASVQDRLLAFTGRDPRR